MGVHVQKYIGICRIENLPVFEVEKKWENFPETFYDLTNVIIDSFHKNSIYLHYDLPT